MVINRGSTRITFITKKYAIKIPNFTSWERLIRGIMANLRESKYGIHGFTHLTPVLWCSWGSLIIVMPKVKVMTGYKGVKLLDKWKKILTDLPDNERIMYEKIVERKVGALGYYKGNVVSVDYGS